MFETSSDQQSQSSVIVVSNNSVVVGNGLAHSTVSGLSPHHNVAVSSAVDLKASNGAITAINDAIADVIDQRHHHHHHNGSSNCHIISSYYYCTTNLINFPHHHFNIFNLSSSASAASSASANRHTNHTTTPNTNMCTTAASSPVSAAPISLKSTSDLGVSDLENTTTDLITRSTTQVDGQLVDDVEDESTKICSGKGSDDLKATTTDAAEEPSASTFVESFTQKVVIESKLSPSSTSNDETESKSEQENTTTTTSENESTKRATAEPSSRRLFRLKASPPKKKSTGILKHRRSLRLANQKSGVTLGDTAAATTRSKTRKRFSAFFTQKLSKLATSSSSSTSSGSVSVKKRPRVVSSKSLFSCLSDQTSTSSIFNYNSQHAVFKEPQSSPSSSSTSALLVASACASETAAEQCSVVEPKTSIVPSTSSNGLDTAAKKGFFKRKLFKSLRPSKRLKASKAVASKAQEERTNVHENKAVDDDASLCNLTTTTTPFTDTQQQQSDDYECHHSSTSTTTSSSSLTSPSSSSSILEVAYAESTNILREMIMPDNCFESSLNGLKKPEFATLSNPFERTVQAFQSSASSFADMETVSHHHARDADPAAEDSENNTGSHLHCSTSPFNGYNPQSSSNSPPNPSHMQQHHNMHHHHPQFSPHQHQMHTDLLFGHQQQLNPFASDIEMMPMGHHSLHQVAQSQQEFLFDNRSGFCAGVNAALAVAAHTAASTVSNVTAATANNNNLIKQDLLKLSYDKFKQYRLNEKLLPQTVLVRNAIKLLQYDLQYQQEQEQQQQMFLQQQQLQQQQQQQQMEYMINESSGGVAMNGSIDSNSNSNAANRYSGACTQQPMSNYSFGSNSKTANVNNIISMIPYENLEEFFNRSEFANNPMMIQQHAASSSNGSTGAATAVAAVTTNPSNNVNNSSNDGSNNQGAANTSGCFYVNMDGAHLHDQLTSSSSSSANSNSTAFYNGATQVPTANSSSTTISNSSDGMLMNGDSSHQSTTSSSDVERAEEEDDDEEDEEDEEEEEEEEEDEEDDEDEDEDDEDEEEDEDDDDGADEENQNECEEDGNGDENENESDETRQDKQTESNEPSNDHAPTKDVQEASPAENSRSAASSSSSSSASSSVSSSSSSDITFDDNFYVDIDNFEHDEDYDENGLLLGSRTTSYSINANTFNQNEFNSLTSEENRNYYSQPPAFYRPQETQAQLQNQQYSPAIYDDSTSSSSTAANHRPTGPNSYLLTDTTTSYNNLATVSPFDAGHYIAESSNGDANCKPFYLVSSSTTPDYNNYNPTHFNENDESK